MNTPASRISLAPLISACAVAVAVTTPSARAQPCGGYEVTAIIQTPVDCGFGFDITTGLGLNDDGAVVGYYWCSGWEHKEAFVWTAEEGFVTLERPQGVVSARAVDINDEGVICGTVVVSGLGNRGFVYGYEGDQFTILGTLPGGNWSEAHAIDSAGEIVGFWGDILNGPFPQAFIWRDGETIDIHPDFGTKNSRAYDINGNSIVTGWMGISSPTDARAFIWENGKVTELPPVPGGFTSQGWTINNRQDVAGRGRIVDPRSGNTVNRAFAWIDGQMFLLGTLPGFPNSLATGINDNQTVIGFAMSTSADAFVWKDGEMAALDDLIPPELGLDFSTARGINQAGQIVASATNEFNDLVAVLLTPIQGPAGDLNNDCQVGVVDLLILLGNWGPCDNCEDCPADLNGDCVVGAVDLVILLMNWG